MRGYIGDGVKPNRWWYTDDHPHADEYDKETPSGWEETGTMYDAYSGTKRRHMGRQIGFLSGDVTMPKVGDKKFPYTKKGKKDAKKAAKQMTPAEAKRRMKEAR